MRGQFPNRGEIADRHGTLRELRDDVKLVASDSKHAIKWDRPQAVIDAVLDVLATARGDPA